MNCQQCGREAVSEAKFCVDCGSPLELRCPACQTPYDLGSRFCSLCGRSLPEAGLSEQLDPVGQPEVPKQFGVPQQSEMPTQIEQPSQPAPQSMSCPRCHQKNAVDADFCFACGMPLDDFPIDTPLPSPSVGPSSDTLAGFWVRLVAFVIDNVLVLFAAVLVDLFFGRDSSAGSRPLILMTLIYLVYFTALISTKSTTIGKGFFGLYVVQTNDSRVGFVRAFFRSLTSLASAYFLGLGFLMVAFREDKRGLHDIICRSKVVKRDTRLF